MASLSRNGRLTFVTGALLTAGGLASASDFALSAGPAVLLGASFAWAWATAEARRLRRARLEFTWWPESGDPAGASFLHRRVQVRCLLRNPTDRDLVLSEPRAVLSPGLELDGEVPGRLVLPPNSTLTFSLRFTAPRAGRHVAHGLWVSLRGPLDLTWLPLYFPNPLALDVAPPVGVAIRQRLASARAQLLVGHGARRRGSGSEVRELREMTPGDPIRKIAWKASARRGKILVRESDDETRESRIVVLDASATLRGLPSVRWKLDDGVDLLVHAARASVAAGDRLGFVAFDRRVLCRHAPDAGAGHAARIVQDALRLYALTDADLTEEDEDGVARFVARYLREQEGVDLRGFPDVAQLRAALAERVRPVVRDDATDPWPLRAADADDRVLRSFCRVRALQLPLRHDASGAARAAGLTQALNACGEGAREGRTIVVCTDLATLEELGPVADALRRLRRARHRITFVVPPEPPVSVSDELTGALDRLFTEDQRAHTESLRPALAALGVPLIVARRGDSPARWLRIARSPRMRAA